MVMNLENYLIMIWDTPLKDRNKNANRIINTVEYLYNQGLDIIVSANITSPKYLKILKKN